MILAGLYSRQVGLYACSMKLFIALLLASACLSCSPQPDRSNGSTPGVSPLAGADWPAYLGDYGRSHYSALEEITPDNVAQLEVAWAYDAGELRAGASTMHTSPLIVDGILYGLSPRLVAFALDAATGEEIWRFDPGATVAEQRGLMWWQRGGEHRLLYVADSQLVALDADSGTLITDFANGGRLELQPGDRAGPLTVTVPGVVYQDSVIVGFSTSESANALPGMIRAFDVRSGDELWRFNTIPLPGQPAAQTWASQSLPLTGGANNWAGMTLDEERGLLFVPTGSATPDFYGAMRPGDNLFANSLVALNAGDGSYRWHFQVVRHDLWDRDLPAPPTLVHLQREGVEIDAVAQTTKTGHLFLFERDTGRPLYEIVESEGLPSVFPDERPAASQPLSTVSFTRQAFELTTRSNAAADFVSEQIANLDQRLWAPPSLSGALIYPAFDGGANWGGAAYNPDGDKLIVNAQELGGILRLVPISGTSVRRGLYVQQCAACHGVDREGTAIGPALEYLEGSESSEQISAILASGRGRMPSFASLSDAEKQGITAHLLQPGEDDRVTAENFNIAFGGYKRVIDHQGLPGNTPPWGTLSAIDLASGAVDWQINLGNYPGFEDLNFGAENYGGPVVTASGLVFIAATPDRKFRAFSASDGELLWESDLPAAGFATPSVYSAAGRQYIVIAAGGGKLGAPSGSYYVAYRLP